MYNIIKEINGKDEIFYSKEYLIDQLNLAYQAGLYKGIRVNFHAIEPSNINEVNLLKKEFNKLLNEEFNKAFKNSEIIKII